VACDENLFFLMWKEAMYATIVLDSLLSSPCGCGCDPFRWEQHLMDITQARWRDLGSWGFIHLTFVTWKWSKVG
jgi:hypothetical protein